MKKLVAALLVSSMVLGLCSCKQSEETTSATTESMGTDQSIEVTTTTEATEASTEPSISEDPDIGTRATSELFDGAYALDESFNDPETFAWHVYTESNGSYALSDEDGKMVAKIQTPGFVKHACQIYRDGFQIYQNAEYQIDFDIYSDIERDFEWRIQVNGGDYHAYYVEESAHMGTEPTHITAVFTMYEPSDPAPRFCFNLGPQGDLDDKTSHTVYIDNLTMQVLNSSNAVEIEPLPPANPVALNQLGYQPHKTNVCQVYYLKETDYRKL